MADVGIVVGKVVVVIGGVDVIVLVVVVVVVVEVDVGVGTKVFEVVVVVDGVVEDFAEHEQETDITMVNIIINPIARQ